MFCGSRFSLVVMDGATRNPLAQCLWNEPVSFRTTYRAVKSRFWGRLGASIVVSLWLGFTAWRAFMAFYLSFSSSPSARSPLLRPYLGGWRRSLVDWARWSRS